MDEPRREQRYPVYLSQGVINLVDDEGRGRPIQLFEYRPLAEAIEPRWHVFGSGPAPLAVVEVAAPSQLIERYGVVIADGIPGTLSARRLLELAVAEADGVSLHGPRLSELYGPRPSEAAGG